jgi:hypothetical protein
VKISNRNISGEKSGVGRRAKWLGGIEINGQHHFWRIESESKMVAKEMT